MSSRRGRGSAKDRDQDEAVIAKRVERMGKRDVFDIPEARNNPISVILIKRFTVDEKLDAHAMLTSLCKFVSSKSVDEKLEFIFSVYDLDKDGKISEKDLFEIIKVLNRGILDDWKVQNIVDKTLAEVGEYRQFIECEEFKELVKRTTKNLKVMFGCTR